MMSLWVSKSVSYYTTSDTPIYISPMENYLLVRMDYMGFYFPCIFFHKFSYIVSILTTHLPCRLYEHNVEIAPQKLVDRVDLTDDFHNTANIACINFDLFPIAFYYLLVGDTLKIKQYKDVYGPLIPFFEYIGLDPFYQNLMT